MTDWIMVGAHADDYGVRSESSYSKRIPDLVEMGLVENTDRVRLSYFENEETVWRALKPREIADIGEVSDVESLRNALRDLLADYDLRVNDTVGDVWDSAARARRFLEE